MPELQSIQQLMCSLSAKYPLHNAFLCCLCFVVVVQASNGERLEEGAEGATEQQQDGVKVRRRGFPRIIKAGHGIKLGAVVSMYVCVYVHVCVCVSPESLL